MKPGAITLSLVLWLGASPLAADAQWLLLDWMEQPASDGPSTLSRAEDRTEFLQTLTFTSRNHNQESWQKIKERLSEGDVIAYREESWYAGLQILLLARLNKLPYALFKYGHLAMVVKDPDDENSLRLLSSWSFKGPNISEDLDSLKYHNWDAYRLNQWERVNKERLDDFVRLVRAKAGQWYGYDFIGMFGLWNSNIRPSSSQEIGQDYTCVTVVAAALHFAGVELDAYKRHGIADIVTPLQIVRSRGRIVVVPRAAAARAATAAAILETSIDYDDISPE
ncbi:MAG TPA: hypothetical protein VFU31_18210 [Candidatus Binatia bacterium]|nr:hypothetical protein [Candidatus Binatia bacterium]